MPEQDKMVQCPYNEAHNILAYRMATHLAKCRKQHPGAPLRRCPFNTTHDVPAPEFEYHLTVCPSKKKVDIFKYAVGEAAPIAVNPNLIQVSVPSGEENWDEEEGPTVSYLDEKDSLIESKLILRQAVALPKAQRREYAIQEVNRFSNIQRGETSTTYVPSTSSIKVQKPGGQNAEPYEFGRGLGRGTVRQATSASRVKFGVNDDDDDDDDFQIVVRKGHGRGSKSKKN